MPHVADREVDAAVAVDVAGRDPAGRERLDQPDLAAYATEVHARALAQVIGQVKPWAVLVPFTALGKDLAPRVAAKVGAGLASDCVALAVKDGRLEARRPMYAGKAYATVRWEGEPQLATLRPNVFALGAPDPGRKAEAVREVVRLVVQELRGMKVEPPEAELRRAKDHLKGSLMLSLESTSSRMSNLARQEMYFDRHFSLDETLEGIEKVTPADIRRVAGDLFSNGSLAATVLGAVNGLEIPRSRLDLG